MRCIHGDTDADRVLWKSESEDFFESTAEVAAAITERDERVWSGWIMPSDRPKNYPKNSDKHCATCGGRRTILSSDADTARF